MSLCDENEVTILLEVDYDPIHMILKDGIVIIIG